VNMSSAAVDIAAAAMPDNQALGIASTALGVASMVTPQGAAKKVVEEGAEIAVEKLITHADDIVDVAKAVPTPPTQLADDVAAAAAAAKPPAGPLAATPKAPNAPPAVAPNVAKTPDVPAAGIPGEGNSVPLPPAAADQRLTTNITARAPLRKDTKRDIYDAAERDPESGVPLDPNTFEPIHGTPDIGHKPGFEERTTNEMVTQHGLSRREKLEWSNDPSHYQLEARGPNRTHRYENPRSASDMHEDYKEWLQRNVETNPRLAQDPTAQRRLNDIQAQARPTGATEQRQIQQANVERTAEQQRDAARGAAREANQGSSRDNSTSRSSKPNSKPSNKKRDKKSKQNHHKPKG
jgi:hypothetical protein